MKSKTSYYFTAKFKEANAYLEMTNYSRDPSKLKTVLQVIAKISNEISQKADKSGAIKHYLDSISAKSSIKFIILKDDLSHIYEINKALAENELICFTGDRYLQGVKYLTAPFLGEDANFPAGPFLIASRLQVPVVFVYVMKEPNLHYHLYAREAEVKHRDERALLNTYLQSVESMIQRYPLQWYNYFDFWGRFTK